MRLSLALLCLASAGLSQRLSFGVDGGLRLTGDLPLYNSSNSKRYLVGPKLELRLPFHFALEANAIYSRLGNTTYIPLVANEYTIRTIANSWAFPLLVKYGLPVRRATVFLSAGFAPRHASGSIHSIHYGYHAYDVTFSSEDWHAHDYAWVLGGGIELALWKIRITPEIRYLRWKGLSEPSPGDAGAFLQFPQNEAQALLGISWPGR